MYLGVARDLKTKQNKKKKKEHKDNGDTSCHRNNLLKISKELEI